MTGVEQAEARLRAAMLTSDVAALEELLAEDVVYVDQTGACLTRADDLAMHASGRLKIEAIDVIGTPAVRAFGNVAVVVTRARLTVAFDGAAMAGSFTYTRVWRHDDGWRVVSAHCSGG